ncbi:hypothetical protein OY671_008876, partial [Metschnikowia pulcherrima]
GYGMSSDAHHITAPDKDGPRRGILNASRNGGSNSEDVQYVNAHGTSTPSGDKNESDASKSAFGDHAKKSVVNSTKSMTGHSSGAAGGIEAVFTTSAVYNQVSPPTINIFNQDPECDSDYCANEARQMKIDVGSSNSFGFGGTNATSVFKRLDAGAGFDMSKLMQGKRGLIMGVANDQSIAWGIAKALHAQGAELAFTYQGDALGKRVKPLAESLNAPSISPCDVEDIASV